MFEEEINKLLEINDLDKLKTELKELYITAQKLKMRQKIKKATISEPKFLESFNFALLPAIIKPKVIELVKGNYIKNGENVLILGPTGTGKTHVATGLAIEALKDNKSVKFINASEFFRNIEKIQLSTNKKDFIIYVEKQIKNLLKPDLLIFDDIGIKKIEGINGEILHQIITKRHGKKSIVFTSNVGPQNWIVEKVFSFPILDRIHEKGVHKLEFIAPSFRTGGKI